MFKRSLIFKVLLGLLGLVAAAGAAAAALLPLGDSNCRACGLRIRVEVEEPRCPDCGYLLYMLTGARCPECGTPIGSVVAGTRSV